MSIDVDKIVRSTVTDFRYHLDNTKALYADLVATLTSEVEEVGMDSLDDYFMDVIDETRGHIASKAANKLEGAADQENAISQVENWFSDNISDQGAEIAVVCAIWGYGPERAPDEIRVEIANLANPAP